MLPRKNTHLKRTRESLEGAAFAIGVLVAVERNRQRLTQWDLAGEIGTDQIAVSQVENGQPTQMTNAEIDSMLSRLELPAGGVHASFLKWWRDNSTL
jgi:DNA-binding XRE family transcriptional regulator